MTTALHYRGTLRYIGSNVGSKVTGFALHNDRIDFDLLTPQTSDSYEHRVMGSATLVADNRFVSPDIRLTDRDGDPLPTEETDTACLVFSIVEHTSQELRVEGKWICGNGDEYLFDDRLHCIDPATPEPDGGVAKRIAPMLNKLEDRHFTDWHDAEAKPATPGPYRCLYQNGQGRYVEVYSTWTGTCWTTVKPRLEDLDNARGQANHQDIRWRGLTEEGYRYLTDLIAADNDARLARENLALLEQIRTVEKQAASFKERADKKYMEFISRCRKDRRLAERARESLHTGDLISLRPSLQQDDCPGYQEAPGATLAARKEQLEAALAAAKQRCQYWDTVWHNELRLDKIVDPSIDAELEDGDAVTTPKGMTVEYGENMKSKLSKHSPPWAIQGSFGSKAK
ncbi:hypothetical protein [Massilia sp. ST3]|uniref:hypothetical protein n=1 Tax=Massilia sp. ST3 TaxID=2824903 RepID=UPI001B816D97|nr:hypothetical protein [Massilia sp. ST3]MBQ5948552.1 hypothetical protein [Massilia sp. ST3]